MLQLQSQVSSPVNLILKTDTLLNTEKEFTDQPINFPKPLLQRQQQPQDEQSPKSIRLETGKYKQGISFLKLNDGNNTSYKKKNTSKNRTDKSLEQPRKDTIRAIWIQKGSKPRLAQKFLSKLQKVSNNVRLESLTKKQLELISYFTNSNLEDGSLLLKHVSKFPLISNQSLISTFFEIFFVFATKVSIIWYPFMLSFLHDQKDVIGEVFFILNCIVHMLVQFNTIKIERGSPVQDRRSITIMYLQGDFFKDICALVVLVLYHFVTSIGYQSFLIFLYLLFRIPRMMVVIESLIENFNINLALQDLISLIGMIVNLFTLIHFFACLWHGIAIQSEHHENWISYYGFQHKSIYDRYIVSLYWAAMTVTTVGYGDITAKNSEEYLISNITLLISCICFGYTMNRIGILLMNLNTRQAELRNNITLLNTYMSKNGVDKHLQSRVRNYIEYLSIVESDQYALQAEGQIEKLPESIRSELNHQIKGSMIQKSIALCRFSEKLKKKMCSIIQEVYFQPNEVICDRDCIDGCCLYFIRSGTAQVSNPVGENTDKLQITMSEGFGEVSFFTSQPRTVKIVSQDFSKMFRIARAPFVEMLREYPKDRVKKQVIKRNCSIILEIV